MGLVEKHPKDKGKYQSTFDTYGHGKGNGKSRAAVYKHANKIKAMSETVSQNVEEVQEEIPEVTQNVEEPVSDWESIEWLDDSNDEGLPSPTIPAPLRKLSEGGAGLSIAQKATQSKLIRWAYMGIDRGLSHWGKGVMQKPEWEIKRHPMDYDALEGATMHMMDSNGISINLSPNLVFMTVLTSAYVPPITHVAKNSQGRLKFKFNLKSLFRNPFKRTKKQKGLPKIVIEDAA
tara:strand:+ start:564 stop:1262 length:699 start_codon:yes stop_codon:yes gene_type:complete